MLSGKTNLVIKITNAQKTFTCPKSTTETQGHGANYAQSRQQSHQHDANCVVLVSLLHNQEHTPHSAPMSPLSTLNMQLPAGYLQLELIL